MITARPMQNEIDVAKVTPARARRQTATPAEGI
jgi:hypothetical protein